MATCIICENEFKDPISNKKKDQLYHSLDPETNEENFMCEGCHHERANAEYRYIDGVMLCSKMGCARNAIVMSKYCEICINQ